MSPGAGSGSRTVKAAALLGRAVVERKVQAVLRAERVGVNSSRGPACNALLEDDPAFSMRLVTPTPFGRRSVKGFLARLVSGTAAALV